MCQLHPSTGSIKYNAKIRDTQTAEHNKQLAAAKVIWSNCSENLDFAFYRLEDYFNSGKLEFGVYMSIRNHIYRLAETERTANAEGNLGPQRT